MGVNQGLLSCKRSMAKRHCRLKFCQTSSGCCHKKKNVDPNPKKYFTMGMFYFS